MGQMTSRENGMISINSATVFILLCFTMSFLRSADLQESTRPELLIDIKVGSSVVVHEIFSDHEYQIWKRK